MRLPEFCSRMTSGSGAADVERPVKMHLHHRIEILVRHLVKEAIAQDTGIVDHRIKAAESVGGLPDHGTGAARVGHIVAIGHGAPAQFFDLGYGILCRSTGRALAIKRGPQVVDNDRCAGLGRLYGDGTTDAATGSGNQQDFPVQRFGFRHISSIVSEFLVKGFDQAPSRKPNNERSIWVAAVTSASDTSSS